ncbi:YbfB/YjiJ family MFS transporter [Herminiimonas sp. CN]|uniref:YbfB/YjiJ family MFS transporter n=1 Tax=Herminiimonas sp. CN TaxID=1349818 RepID=UPI001EE677DD|nr:YbfB/YjiJ family MFS transporter [Herminiimonas sp. CN]
MRRPFLTALAISLGAAVSLGMSRFSYALLLPPMRSDLGWTYLLAGAMNTGNAFGYFIGALMTPALLRRCGAHRMLVAGALLAALFMLLSGLATATGLLLCQRILSGVASAFIFISGGVLAARLGGLHPRRAGFLIGLYYGGTGFGIVLSALLVPATLAAAADFGAAHGWQWAWLALGGACLLATLGMALPARQIPDAPLQAGPHNRFRIGSFGYGLAAYFMFGAGYIGYMTFVIALLKEQGMSAPLITLFYTLLGLAVLASSRVWAGMLDHFKGGQSLAILNGLLAAATLLPALTATPLLVFASGILFGGVFLSVVASTTALVRHNLPPPAWSAGISAFTTVFAFGQIIGPSMVGWIADGPGGLQRGLAFSALALLLGALLALRQRALPH